MEKYEIIRLISNTLKSKVYLAKNNNKYFVIKNFYRKEDLNRELNNAKIINNLENPYTVKFIELYDDKLIYEYFDGEILEDKIYNIELNIKYKVIDNLINFLYLLNKKGYYYLDLNLSNILIDKDNNIKIIDYGSLSNNSNVSIKLGSFFLVPPEYYLDDILIIDKFDVFSLGNIIFILLFRFPLIKTSKCYIDKCWRFCNKKCKNCDRQICLEEYLDELTNKFKIKKIYKELILKSINFDNKKRFNIKEIFELKNHFHE